MAASLSLHNNKTQQQVQSTETAKITDYHHQHPDLVSAGDCHWGTSKAATSPNWLYSGGGLHSI
jgi:hypothetical protein